MINPFQNRVLWLGAGYSERHIGYVLSLSIWRCAGFRQPRNLKEALREVRRSDFGLAWAIDLEICFGEYGNYLHLWFWKWRAITLARAKRQRPTIDPAPIRLPRR